MNHFSCYSVY